ncbi:MAG: G1 family glutamic endopeptidase [Solirubrobacteraceae bacterium]
MSCRAISVAVVALAALAAVPAALADSTQSSNWAGYAVHRSSVRYTRATGTWVQPQATCVGGRPTYSSVWVGIGGYSLDSQALEQIGTEADCTASGRAVSTAWYELVPDASHAIRLTIEPGDRVRATVSVQGSQVTLALSDLTRRRSFTKRLRTTTLDTTSAEWILEAPSVCTSAVSCHTLPLADFGSAGFSSASAVTTTGHRGTIADRRWTATRISLAATGRQFVSNPGAPLATAVPSTLSADGSAFTVTYSGSGAPSGPVQGARMAGDRRALSPSS